MKPSSRDICVFLAPFLPGAHRLYLKRSFVGYIQLSLWLPAVLSLVLMLLTQGNPAVVSIGSIFLLFAPMVWLWAYVEAHCLKVDGFGRPILPGSWLRRQGWRLLAIIPLIWLLCILSLFIPSQHRNAEFVNVLFGASIVLSGIIGARGHVDALKKKLFIFNGAADLYLGALLGALHIAGIILIFGGNLYWGTSYSLIGWGIFALSLGLMWLMQRKLRQDIPFCTTLTFFCARVLLLTTSVLISVFIVGATTSLKEELRKSGSSAAVRTGDALKANLKHVWLKGKFKQMDNIIAAAVILGAAIFIGKRLWDTIKNVNRTAGQGINILTYGMTCVTCAFGLLYGATVLSDKIPVAEKPQVAAARSSFSTAAQPEPAGTAATATGTAPAPAAAEPPAPQPAEPTPGITQGDITPLPPVPHPLDVSEPIGNIDEAPQEATLPAPAADFARQNMDGLLITCSYAAATMAQQTEEDYDFRPFEPIVAQADGTFNSEAGPRHLTCPLKVYNARKADGSAARLVKYEKISPTEAELRVIRLMVHDAEAVGKIQDVLSRLNQLTVAQIKQQLANYLLDEEETITITMTSPTEGRATALIDSGCVKVKFRNIAIRVDKGVAPDAVLAEQPDAGDGEEVPTHVDVPEPDFEAEVDGFIATLTDMRAQNNNTALFRKRLLTLLPLIRESRNADLTLPETKGNTALHYACGLGYFELVDWLLEQNADVHKRTDRGMTPRQCIGNDPDGMIRFRLEHAEGLFRTPGDMADE